MLLSITIQKSLLKNPSWIWKEFWGESCTYAILKETLMKQEGCLNWNFAEMQFYSWLLHVFFENPIVQRRSREINAISDKFHVRALERCTMTQFAQTFALLYGLTYFPIIHIRKDTYSQWKWMWKAELSNEILNTARLKDDQWFGLHKLLHLIPV